MLTKVQTIVQNAIDLGIYVIIDWHTSTAVTATGTQAAQASEFFTMMAQKYGTTPNVIYEDYNEPNKVTWAQIKPYHEAVVAAIRAVDPDNLIILGTPTYSQDVDVAAADPVAGTQPDVHAAFLRVHPQAEPARQRDDGAVDGAAAVHHRVRRHPGRRWRRQVG